MLTLAKREFRGILLINIIDYINRFPYLYDYYREDIYNAINPFVETQSFRDFIINL